MAIIPKYRRVGNSAFILWLAEWFFKISFRPRIGIHNSSSAFQYKQSCHCQPITLLWPKGIREWRWFALLWWVLQGTTLTASQQWRFTKRHVACWRSFRRMSSVMLSLTLSTFAVKQSLLWRWFMLWRGKEEFFTGLGVRVC